MKAKKSRSKKALKDKILKHEKQEDKMINKFKKVNKKFEKSVK